MVCRPSCPPSHHHQPLMPPNDSRRCHATVLQEHYLARRQTVKTTILTQNVYPSQNQTWKKMSEVDCLSLESTLVASAAIACSCDCQDASNSRGFMASETGSSWDCLPIVSSNSFMRLMEKQGILMAYRGHPSPSEQGPAVRMVSVGSPADLSRTCHRPRLHHSLSATRPAHLDSDAGVRRRRRCPISGVVSIQQHHVNLSPPFFIKLDGFLRTGSGMHRVAFAFQCRLEETQKSLLIVNGKNAMT